MSLQLTPVLAAALLVAGTAAAAGAQAFAYTPGSQKYRVDQTLAMTQTVQGTTQSTTTQTAQFISLDVASRADSLALTYVVDSVSITPDPASPQDAATAAAAAAAAEGLRGRSVVGAMSPQGHLGSLAEADGNATDGGTLAQGFRAFLVPVPTEPMRAGLTWTDTVTNEFKGMGGIDGTTVSMMTYTVAGDTTVHGQKAWRVMQEGTIRMSGMGAAQGTDVAMSGEGTMTGHALLGERGVYLGGEVEQTQNMTVEVPAANMTIPITNRVSTKVAHIGS